MKMMTEAEYNDLMVARQERDAYEMVMAQKLCGTDQLKTFVELIVSAAAKAGVVLTVEQRPLTPLAMGHHETVVSVRPARMRS